MTVGVLNALALALTVSWARGLALSAPALDKPLYHVLCLTEGLDPQAWPEEAAWRLNNGSRERLFVLVQSPASLGAAFERRLEQHTPRLVVARRQPPSAVAAALRARGLTLLVVPPSSGDGDPEGSQAVAREVLKRAGDSAGNSQASDERLLADWRRLVGIHQELQYDQGTALSLSQILALAPKDSEAWRQLLSLGLRDNSPWEALRNADAWVAVPGLSPAQRAEALRARSLARLRLGNSLGAAADLRAALPLAPADWDAEYRLAITARDHPQEALKHARQAARQAPTRRKKTSAHRLAAQIQLDLQDEAASRESLEQALALDPGDLEALIALARLKVRSPRQAAEILRRAWNAAEAAPPWQRAAAYRLCAGLAVELGAHERAAQGLRRALDLEPEYTDALKDLLLLKRRDPKAVASADRAAPRTAEEPPQAPSEEALSRALALDPDDLELLRQAIARRRAQRRLPEASALARRFMDAVWEAPQWQRLPAYVLIAPIWMQLGDLAQTRRSVELAGHLDRASITARSLRLFLEPMRPRSRHEEASHGVVLASGYVDLARTRRELGDAAGALESVTKALAFVPDDLFALHESVDIEFALGRPERALARARALVDAAKTGTPGERAAAYRRLGHTRLTLGDEPGAIADLERALTLSPGEPAALRTLFDLHSRRPPSERLRYGDLLVESMSLASPANRAAAHRRRAQARLAAQDPAGALLDLEQALKLAPADAAALQTLVEVHMPSRPSEALRHADLLVASSAKAPAEERAAAHRLRARARQAGKDAAGALSDLERALALKPGEAATLQALVEFHMPSRPSSALRFAGLLVDSSAQAPALERAAALRLRALARQATQDASGALSDLESALKLAPGQASTLQALVDLHAPSNPPAALRYAGLLVEASAHAAPEWRAAALWRRAQMKIALGDEAAAGKDLERALALAPGEASTLKTLIRLHLRRRPTSALRYADLLVEAAERASAAERSAAYRERALARLAAQDAAGALADLEQAFALAPGDASTLEALVDLHMASRPSSALRYAGLLVEAAAQAPSARRAAAHRSRGEARRALGEEKGAIEDFERALTLSPLDPAALQALFQLHSRRPSSALRYADLLVASLDKAPAEARASALRQRAQARQALGDRAGAAEDLERSLAAFPGDMESLWLLVESAARAPAQTLDLVARHRPSGAPALSQWLALRALTRAALGDLSGARTDLSEAISADPDGVCFGELFERRRDRLAALYYDRCLERFPDSAALHQGRGIARHKAGEVAASAADFRRAVELKPAYAEARLSLATVLAQQGRLREALAVTEQAAAGTGELQIKTQELRNALRARLR